ncbi:MAG TPA: pseudaminic acid cytidylyltransferase [Polyangia bacterium]|jgi:N-acylneuraminate cytidylyltransferase
MTVEHSALAIIPARGGSKRIPRKNVKSFLGQPIIKYSIDAALGAGLFDEVMVSSDDAEIRELSGRLGACAPFARSAAASSDVATTAEVILEVLESYRQAGREFAYVCCIYPTAPLVTAERLREAWDLLLESGADSALPIMRFGFPIWRAFKLTDGRLRFEWPENAVRRSQDLPASFHDCGQFYFLKTASFLAHRALVMPHTVPLIVPESEAQDIDTDEDWKLAELKYTQRRVLK